MAASPASGSGNSGSGNKTDLDAEWEKQVKEIFTIYDKESNNQLSSEDIGDAIRSCGLRLTNDQLDQFKKEIELEHDGRVSYKLFLDYVNRGNNLSIRDSQITQSFEMFSDDNGYIKIDKFKHALQTLGDKLSKDEIDTILKDAGFDENLESTIHYSKLLALVQNNVF